MSTADLATMLKCGVIPFWRHAVEPEPSCFRCSCSAIYANRVISYALLAAYYARAPGFPRAHRISSSALANKPVVRIANVVARTYFAAASFDAANRLAIFGAVADFSRVRLRDWSAAGSAIALNSASRLQAAIVYVAISFGLMFIIATFYFASLRPVVNHGTGEWITMQIGRASCRERV